MRRRANAARAILLVLLVLLGTGPASAAVSSWRELVREMSRRPPDEQKMFAALALNQLIARHEHEIGRAARGKAQGWQRGMRSYIARLEEMARLVDAGEPVRMVREAGGEVRMIVGHRQAMLATANPGGQGAYERAVLEAWCASADCTGGGALAATAPVAPAAGVPPAPSGPAIDATRLQAAPSAPVVVLDAPAPVAAVAAAQSPVETATPTAVVKSFAAGERPAVAPATALPAVQPPPPAPPAGVAVAETPAVPVHPLATPVPAPPASAEAPAVRPTVRLSPTVEAPAAENVRGNWSFGDRAPPLYAAEDGLQCAFADLRHLKLKQAACAAVMTELRELLALLRRETRDGSRVAWAQLSLRPAGAEAPALLQLAPGQRPIPFTAPYLTAAPEVLASARDWLQARLAGQPAVCRINAPEALGYLTPPTLVSAP